MIKKIGIFFIFMTSLSISHAEYFIEYDFDSVFDKNKCMERCQAEEVSLPSCKKICGVK